MKLMTVPYYCGGRLLVGLWDIKYPMPVLDGIVNNDEEWTDHLIQEQIASNNNFGSYYTSMDSYKRAYYDPYPRIPQSLYNFQRVLANQIGYLPNKVRENVFVGVIIAVTNKSQTTAARFLSETGFKEAGKYCKFHTGLGGYCTTWLGDVHKDILPVLVKQNFEVKTGKTKFA